MSEIDELMEGRYILLLGNGGFDTGVTTGSRVKYSSGSKVTANAEADSDNPGLPMVSVTSTIDDLNPPSSKGGRATIGGISAYPSSLKSY